MRTSPTQTIEASPTVTERAWIHIPRWGLVRASANAHEAKDACSTYQYPTKNRSLIHTHNYKKSEFPDILPSKLDLVSQVRWGGGGKEGASIRKSAEVTGYTYYWRKGKRIPLTNTKGLDKDNSVNHFAPTSKEQKQDFYRTLRKLKKKGVRLRFFADRKAGYVYYRGAYIKAEDLALLKEEKRRKNQSEAA